MVTETCVDCGTIIKYAMHLDEDYIDIDGDVVGMDVRGEDNEPHPTCVSCYRE